MKQAVIIGSGNLTNAMVVSCLLQKIEIIGIHSKNKNTALAISNTYNIKIIDNLESIPNNLDYYFLCVNDDSIEIISNQLNIETGLIIHFSGLKPISTLTKHTNCAVFWPIESINKNTFINFLETPICIEANNQASLNMIEGFANNLSKKVLKVNSNERKYLHLAATITNNFSNHLINLAKNELDHQNLNYSVLKHLMDNSIKNAFNQNPNLLQTGPAIRNDIETMSNHLSLIGNDNLKLLYKLFSKSIFELKQNNNA